MKPRADQSTSSTSSDAHQATSLPNIVIVGRPNVGKSLLFNRLVGKPTAIVHAQPGMTLDFQRLPVDIDGRRAWLLDTGGSAGEEDEWTPLIAAQMRRACDMADFFLLVVDARRGIIGGDSVLAHRLRARYKKPWWLVVNKAEHMDAAVAVSDFHSLGAAAAFAVSAKTTQGIPNLKEAISTAIGGGGQRPLATAAAKDHDNADTSDRADGELVTPGGATNFVGSRHGCSAHDFISRGTRSLAASFPISTR